MISLFTCMWKDKKESNKDVDEGQQVDFVTDMDCTL